LRDFSALRNIHSAVAKLMAIAVVALQTQPKSAGCQTGADGPIAVEDRLDRQNLAPRRKRGGQGEEDIQTRIDSALGAHRARPHAARVLANNPALVELDLNGMEKWEAQARVSEQEVSLYSAEARKMYPAYLLMEVFGRGFALTSRTPLPGRSPDDRATLFVTEDVLLKVFQDEQPAHNLDPACCDSLLFSD